MHQDHTMLQAALMPGQLCNMNRCRCQCLLEDPLVWSGRLNASFKGGEVPASSYASCEILYQPSEKVVATSTVICSAKYNTVEESLCSSWQQIPASKDTIRRTRPDCRDVSKHKSHRLQGKGRSRKSQKISLLPIGRLGHFMKRCLVRWTLTLLRGYLHRRFKTVLR